MNVLGKNQTKEIQYAMMMKLNMLRRSNLPLISIDELAHAIMKGKWKGTVPAHTSVAVSDIMNISAEEIVTILTRLALVEGGRTDISEFHDLMGGMKDEKE